MSFSRNPPPATWPLGRVAASSGPFIPASITLAGDRSHKPNCSYGNRVIGRL